LNLHKTAFGIYFGKIKNAFGELSLGSLRNLAESLGLSTSTVSRALNGYSDVNEQTRLRVQEAATRIGYRPNGMAVRLATGRTDVFALVTSSREGGAVDPSLTELIAGLSEALAPKGKTIVATSLPSQDELDHFRGLLRSGMFDGYVLARTRPHDARVDLLRAAEASFLTAGSMWMASRLFMKRPNCCSRWGINVLR
jgi:LacI family transcriptional regulator